MTLSYQLTKHPIGTKREFWALTWPLMIGLISSTLMMFVDRLFLAWFDPLALNAAASGGMAYYIFLVIPIGVVAIAEVLVGRLHGEGKLEEIGSAAWQMIWFACLMLPIFCFIGWGLPGFLFAGTGNEVYETEYFQTLMYFAVFQCSVVALSGFFIGVGNVSIVTIAALIGNVVNIGLDYVMIFGWGPFPEWGVTGAAIATGISQVAQVLFLFAIFWNSKNRKCFRTQRFQYNKSYFFEGLWIGLPSGLGRCMEVIAHFLFFRIIMSVGAEQMMIVTMVQSFYILFSFVIEAESKGASAIAANLLGANVLGSLGRVLKSSFILHIFYFALFAGSLCLFPDFFLRIFASSENAQLLADPKVIHTFFVCMLLMSLFFLVDGFGWILGGVLTAAGDTRYVLWVSLAVNWFAYLLPTFWLIGVNKGGPEIAWLIIVMATSLTVISYYFRYRSGTWLKQYHVLQQA
jgi:MATE family multidrug resistance protein